MSDLDHLTKMNRRMRRSIIRSMPMSIEHCNANNKYKLTEEEQSNYAHNWAQLKSEIKHYRYLLESHIRRFRKHRQKTENPI